jgi:ATP-dependent Clp protease ATP-binding subunit ClpB
MTSNLGSQIIQDSGWKNREIMEKRVMEVVRNSFKPEFLNRIDEIIIFNNLDREHLKRIVDIQIQYLRARLRERKMDLELTDEARELLCERGYDPSYGARPLKRAIQKYVQDPLALKILEGEFVEGDKVLLGTDTGNESFTFSH